uniref:Uncharacterized protein n=1 Tax=Globodera rostochiensis TaxID=31243 RepID=A0A914H563_GLORO
MSELTAESCFGGKHSPPIAGDHIVECACTHRRMDAHFSFSGRLVVIVKRIMARTPFTSEPGFIGHF